MREVKRRSVRRRLRVDLKAEHFSTPTPSPLKTSCSANPMPCTPRPNTCTPRPAPYNSFLTPFKPLAPPQRPLHPCTPLRTPYTPLGKDLNHTGSYKRLKSPLMSTSSLSKNKENMAMVESSVEAPVERLMPQVRRRSSMFSPASLRQSLGRVGRPSPSPVFGQGRHIPLMQGHLWKKAGRNWRRKYVTLEEGRLVYHPSLHAYLEDRPGKEVTMDAVTVKVAGMPEGQRMSMGEVQEECKEGLHPFTIISLSQQSWTFGCPGEAVREAWVAALQGSIMSCLQGTNSSNLVDTSTPMVDTLRNIPGNSHCADCRQTRPDWVSLNLGVLLCIECSGAHRNLGSHISKVRSLLLDLLDPATLSHLAAMGNTAGASIWEVGMEEGDRPEAGSSREVRDLFVWRKYVEGRWKAEVAK